MQTPAPSQALLAARRSGIAERLAAIDQRVAALDQRMCGMNQRLWAIGQALSKNNAAFAPAPRPSSLWETVRTLIAGQPVPA